jgi:NTP pyrophosphatase (non-canonical NTP hydrolase)
MLNELAKTVHENAKSKGFYDNKKNIGEMLCLIHSEVSEALEADRNKQYCKIDKPQENVLMGWTSDIDFQHDYKDKVKGSFEEEMADIVIRVLDMCAFKNIDLDLHVKAKMRYNASRQFMHGKSY